jgi:predicted dehydrogenase
MANLAKGDKVRVAMVGAGNMSNRVHYPSLSSFPDVEFAGICDLRPDRLNSSADRCKIGKRYLNYQVMIEEPAPDSVYVIGQPDVM